VSPCNGNIRTVVVVVYVSRVGTERVGISLYSQ